MKFTKIIAMLSVVAIIALFSTVSAQAQLGSPQTVFSTASLTGAKLTNSVIVTNVVDVSAGKDLALAFNFAAIGASTTVSTNTLFTSIDGTVYNPTAIGTVLITQAGATPVALVTNITVGAVQKVRIITRIDSAGVSLTNSTIKAAVK